VLCVLYALMAALPAAPASHIVLSTSGGSPDWLLGPLRFAGAAAADDTIAGPLFYAALWVALILYLVVLAGAAGMPRRLAIGAVVALHLVFLLAPPLLSHDVFSYIAYARLGVAHNLNPYVHAPVEIPADPAFVHAGSIKAVSAYGPLFTLLTYPLSPLGVAAALWILKTVAALASLGIVWIVWRVARMLGRDPLVPALAVGLNPLVLVHVVGGAHNEALTVLLTMAGVALWLGGREAGGVALATVAAGVKASAGLVVPFLVVGRRPGVRAVDADAAPGDRSRVVRLAAAAAAAAVTVALVGIVAFGFHALDAFSLIGDNQGRTSRFSLPHKAAQLLGALLPGNALDYRDVVRTVFAVAFAAVVLWLLWRAWRGAMNALDAIGWTNFAVLVASAWLVPWYILWLLPFAALSRDRRLQVATLALTAWMLAIGVPL
jgi:alpha-1,6-mannosyltransferase